MTLLNNINMIALKRAVSAVLAVTIAWILNDFLGLPTESWMMLTAFVVNYALSVTFARQTLILSLSVLAALLIAGIFGYANWQMIGLFLAEVLFLLSGFWIAKKQILSNRQIILILIFPLMLLIAMVTNPFMHSMKDQFLSVVMGAVIGVVSGYLVFPFKIEAEFRSNIVPLLNALINNLNEVVAGFLKNETNTLSIEEQQAHIEEVLQQTGKYPEWVYERGFNPGLRAGLRFFLVNIDRILEIYFSMLYLAYRGISEGIIHEIKEPIQRSMNTNIELIKILLTYFEDNQLPDLKSDLTSDMAILERALQHIVPGNLELLDITPDYMTLTALVRDIKDMRGLLLQLVMSLPAVQQTH